MLAGLCQQVTNMNDEADEDVKKMLPSRTRKGGDCFGFDVCVNGNGRLLLKHQSSF